MVQAIWWSFRNIESNNQEIKIELEGEKNTALHSIELNLGNITSIFKQWSQYVYISFFCRLISQSLSRSRVSTHCFSLMFMILWVCVDIMYEILEHQKKIATPTASIRASNECESAADAEYKTK